MARRRNNDEPRRASNVVPVPIALNLTPMIDVTFQLLIYFLLGTSFVLGEEIYRADLPNRSDVRSRATEVADEPIVVRVRSLGSGPDDYELDIDGPLSKVSSAAELEAMLNASIVSISNPQGTITRANPIVIAPTADARWEHAIEVFDAAVKARFGRVAFATGMNATVRP
ncbi:MAG: biopolymer transporter ExbD [Phycisphaerae bacterium]|nr:biopolymer transporter ExbD [Phycisphaerae bacterium]